MSTPKLHVPKVSQMREPLKDGHYLRLQRRQHDAQHSGSRALMGFYAFLLLTGLINYAAPEDMNGRAFVFWMSFVFMILDGLMWIISAFRADMLTAVLDESDRLEDIMPAADYVSSDVYSAGSDGEIV